MVFIPDTDGGEAASAAAETTEKNKPPGFVPDMPDDRRPLSNRPDEGTLSGMAKNAATGALKGATWVAGTAGDLNQLGDLASGAMRSLYNGKTTAENLAEIDQRRERIGKAVHGVLKDHLPEWMANAAFNAAGAAPFVGPTISSYLGTPRAPTSEDLQKPLFKATGEYVPETELGQIGQIGTAGAVSMLAPGGWKNPVKSALSGAASAIAGEEVGKHAGPVAGFGASLVAPSAFHLGTKSILGNSTKKAQRVGAGTILRNAATDAEGVANAPIGEGVGPQMLADIKADPGIARAEAVADKIGGPRAKDLIAQTRDNQAAARRGLVASLGNPEGDNSVISSTLQSHLDNLQATHDAKVDAIRRQAEEAARNAPAGGNIEDISRDSLKRVHALDSELDRHFDKAYKMIDPDKTMIVPVMPVRDFGLEMKNRPPRVEPGAADPYIKAASEFSEVMPFSHLWDFDKQLTGAISRAARAGDTTGAGELQALKGVVKKTINSVPEDIHKRQGEQVRAGKMNPDDTLAAAIERQHAPFRATRAEGVSVGEGPQSVSDHGLEDGVRGVSGERGGVPRGGGRTPGDQGMEGPPLQFMDPETAARLAEINKLYGTKAQKFDQGPVGDALRTKAFRDPNTGEVRFNNELGATSAFVPGDKGAINVKAWLAADSSPQAINDLKTLAAQRLREESLKDGVIDPRKFEAAKAKYHNALREVEDASPGFLKSFEDAASATEAISVAEKARTAALAETGKARASKLIGLESGEDLGNKISELIKAKDAYRQVNDFMGKIEHDPLALESARGVTANWIINNLDLAVKDAANRPVLSGAKVEDLVRNKADALHRIFGDAGFDNLVKLQETIAKEQTKQGYQKSAMGSDTAAYLEPLYEKLKQHQASRTMQGLERLTEMGSFALAFGGNWEHALWVGLGRAGLGVMEHFIQKARAKGINSTMDLVHQGLTDAKFGQELMRESIQTERGEKLSPLQILLRARTALGTQEETQHDVARFGRATGGAVTIDHKAEAEKLIKAVEAARKGQAKDTEPLLAIDDSTITKGLAQAGKDI